MDYSNKQLAPCKQKRESCFAFSKGRCRVLHDTEFKRACPFYKPRAVRTASIKKENES